MRTELEQRRRAVRLLGHPGFPGAKFSPRECTELPGWVSPGKHFDNNAEHLGDRGKKKEESVWEQISALTSKALVIQAAVSVIFTWESMKSQITMFSLQLSSSACWVPSAVSQLIINRGALCHLAARVSVLLAAGTQTPQCQVDSTTRPGVSRAAPGSPECPPQALLSRRHHCTPPGLGSSRGWRC